MTDGGGRLFTPAFIALSLSDLAYFVASGLLIGVTPFFVTGPLGAGSAGLGLTLGAFSVVTLVLRPAVGRMTDRLGRRRLLIGGAALFAVTILAHNLVSELWMFVALRLLLGVAEALYFVAGFAALADLAPPARVGEALSWNSLTLYLGLAIGPGVGQVLLGLGGFPAAWAGGTTLAVLAMALATRIPETAPPMPADTAPSPLIVRAVLRPGLGLFTGVAAASGFLAFVGIHAESVGFPAWSTLPLVYGATVIACRVLFAQVPDRVPPLRLGAASLCLCSAGMITLAVIPHTVGLLAGTAILGVGIAFLTPAIFAEVFGVVPAHERGAAAGTAAVFIDLGIGGGPLLLGLAASGAGIPAAFIVAAALTASGAAWLLSAAPGPALPEPA